MKKLKRWLIVFLIVLLCFCAAVIALNRWKPSYPERAADGAAWDERWVILGNALGAEDPGNGFVLLDNNSILTAEDTYLATWTSGEPEAFVNADGDDAELYDAELFLLLVGCKDVENAETAVAEWIAREEQTYDVLDMRSGIHNGQEYTLLRYEVASDANPYAWGATAFGIYKNYAMTAEVICREEYSGDVSEILGAFLDGIHFNAEI